MKKLVNLNIIEANGVICPWREDGSDEQPFVCGIALESARGDYIVPRYIAVGVYDDGSTRAGGLMSLGEVNNTNKDVDDDIFLYDQFLYAVGANEARAFVKGTVESGGYKDEAEAAAMIFRDLVRAGVTIYDSALVYLKKTANKGLL